ncbi:MAG: hypothetical protein Q8R55_00830 [Candidatus Taylorbacteria bacterium]|nr:hypothetical protein [Candidatus Taylorbacteria bacterium]
MKAILFEGKDKRRNRSVIVLLPSGKLEINVGDPANVALELDGDTIRAWIICADEIASLDPVKEVEVEDRFLIEALEYRNIRVVYELRKLEFKDRLHNLMLTPNCDAYFFLDTGSAVL